MRYLGIDYGTVRMGVSISDPFGWTARGLETISWKNDLSAVAERIKQLVKEYGIEKIIVGFPRNMNGTVGFSGERTLKFMDFLADNIKDAEIVKWDERLTTMAANRTMNEIGIKAQNKKKIVDQIAAVYILQNYLDSVYK
jgi:putative Holliday junction resolvase